jgi:hypothetical protein
MSDRRRFLKGLTSSPSHCLGFEMQTLFSSVPVESGGYFSVSTRFEA